MTHDGDGRVAALLSHPGSSIVAISQLKQRVATLAEEPPGPCSSFVFNLLYLIPFSPSFIYLFIFWGGGVNK